eukprot:UN05405
MSQSSAVWVCQRHVVSLGSLPQVSCLTFQVINRSLLIAWCIWIHFAKTWPAVPYQ